MVHNRQATQASRAAAAAESQRFHAARAARAAERVRALRLQAGLSVDELALKARVDRATIERIEAEELRPNVPAFRRLWKPLHVDPVWLMGFDRWKRPELPLPC